jgi:hypothetical protein
MKGCTDDDTLGPTDPASGAARARASTSEVSGSRRRHSEFGGIGATITAYSHRRLERRAISGPTMKS